MSVGSVADDRQVRQGERARKIWGKDVSSSTTRSQHFVWFHGDRDGSALHSVRIDSATLKALQKQLDDPHAEQIVVAEWHARDLMPQRRSIPKKRFVGIEIRLTEN
ncbi:MAG: hypothetical protein ACYDDQ_02985 [Vulcanimicrobiaceae bacterium]